MSEDCDYKFRYVDIDNTKCAKKGREHKCGGFKGHDKALTHNQHICQFCGTEE